MSEVKSFFKKLENKREDILKAEITAYFSLFVDKVNLSSREKREQIKNFPSNISDSFSGSDGLRNEVINRLNLSNKELEFGNYKEKLENLVGRTGKGIFWKDCERINSGIEKGNPDSIDIDYQDFGVFNVFGYKEKKFDLKKVLEKRDDFLKSLKTLEKTISNLNLNNNDSNNSHKKIVLLEDLEEIKTLKDILSSLPSDSRLPVGDVSLWGQTYLSVSLYKARLAAFVLGAENGNDRGKWSILGIIYDKLYLKEQATKLGFVVGYEKKIEELERKIKRLIEIEYPLGNEVYNDETGIYFLVSGDLYEKVGEIESFEYGKFKEFHEEFEQEIKEIFNEVIAGEILPNIVLTKPSRGILTLGELKKNINYFLKPIKRNYKKLEEDNSKIKNYKGLCKICKVRLYNDETGICEKCKEKYEKPIELWKNNFRSTIWMEELKDENNRIALVNLSFDLNDWLNGELVNSMIQQRKYLIEYKSYFVKLFKNIIDNLSKEEVRALQIDECLFLKFLEFFDEKGIQKPFKEIKDTLKVNKNIDNITKENDFNTIAKNLLKNEEWIKIYKFYDETFKQIIKNKKKNKKVGFEQYDEDDGVKNHLYKIFAINYVILQTKNIIFDRIGGKYFEKFVYKKLNDWNYENNKPLKNKINFEEQKINWSNLTDDDLQILAEVLFQLLVRKNPSPGRIYRIWNSTLKFFETIENQILKSENFLVIRKKEVLKQINESLKKDIGKGLEDFIDKSIDDIVKQSPKYHPYRTILKSPITFQFIIQANKTIEILKQVQSLYNEYFKLVKGKVTLKIGLIIQNYKFPLYLGIRALRSLRDEMLENKDSKEFKPISNFESYKLPELEPDTPEDKLKDYLSYFPNQLEDTYKFIIDIRTCQSSKEDEKVKLSTNDDGKCILLNEIDWEILDSNQRRYDITKRYSDEFNGDLMGEISLKKQRPYEFDKFLIDLEKFKKIFKNNKSKLQKLISILLEKYQNWEVYKGKNKKAFEKFFKSTLSALKIPKQLKKIIGNWDDGCYDKEKTLEGFKKLYNLFNFVHQGTKEI